MGLEMSSSSDRAGHSHDGRYNNQYYTDRQYEFWRRADEERARQELKRRQDAEQDYYEREKNRMWAEEYEREREARSKRYYKPSF